MIAQQTVLANSSLLLQAGGKTCSRCKEWKTLNKFYSKPDGVHSQCKQCFCQTQQAYYESHKPNRLLWQAKWRKEHREHYLETLRSWRERHPDKRRVDNQQWRSENRERVAGYHARRRMYLASGEVEVFSRQEIFIRDNGRCHICGKLVDPRKWHLDHLLPLSLGGEHIKRNVAVAHPWCNDHRGNTGPAQMRLFS